MKRSPLRYPAWLIAVVLLLAVAPVRSAETSELYRAATIVTGERDETRFPGIRECFARMMQKVSGDPGIIERPGFADVAARARGMVWSYTYHDRMFGRPLGDEQGTRDRPFDLTVQFEQKMADQALASLGSKPWPEPRPKLLVVLAVRDMVRTFALSSDGPFGRDMREAFADASARYAVPVVFPAASSLAAANLEHQGFDTPMAATTAKLLHEAMADHFLLGRIDWVAADHGWRAKWILLDVPGSATWGISGVNFDAAFRNGVGGAAKILSSPVAP